MPGESIPPIEAILAAIYSAAEAEDSAWAEVQRGEARRTPMFAFAQFLRGTPEFFGAQKSAALKLIDDALRTDDCTLASLCSAHADPAADLYRAWDLVVLPATWEHAVGLARQHPVAVPDAPSARYAAFVALCAALQELSGAAPIIVACARFAAALGVSARQISTYRFIAVQAGLLTLVAPADRGAHRAARYRYIGPRPTSQDRDRQL